MLSTTSRTPRGVSFNLSLPVNQAEVSTTFPKERVSAAFRSGDQCFNARTDLEKAEHRATTSTFGLGSTRRNPNDHLEPYAKVGRISPELLSDFQ